MRSILLKALAPALFWVLAAILFPAAGWDGSTALADTSHVDPVPTAEDFNPEDLNKAIEQSKVVPKLVKEVMDESIILRKQRLREKGLSIKDVKHTFFLLESPIIKQEEDYYGPVKFMHGKHINALEGDCAECHHYRPKDAEAAETVACSSCHQKAFDPEMPERVGLKAAYHNQCLDCHKEKEKGPVDCNSGCHGRNVPKHEDLVKLAENPEPWDVTKECLRCHEKQGHDFIRTAHWLWKGPSPYTVEHTKDVASGKATNTLNNFCIALPSNWPRCTSCHAGYGWKDENFDFTDMTRVDCLVCHDTTNTYQKAPPKAGMPDPKVDLVKVAKNVGKPSRRTCGDCHMSGGGGDAVKHADMSSQLYYPGRTCDVHMGGYDFQCQDCHKTMNHKIFGRSSSLPVAEGSRSCEDCHTSEPHYGEELLDHHLNKHTKHMSCNTCHTPIYSKCKATKTWWDWSKAGDKKREPVKDKYGMPDYNWMKGEFKWKESAKPEYAWHNGYTKRLLLGDKINPDGETNITEPIGTLADPRSRITPFKVMRGIQPADAVNQYLLVPHLFPSGENDTDAYWKGLDWQKAFMVGMEKAGLEYSGKYDWVRTNMYWKVNHEIAPAEMALSCVQCHESLRQEKTCDRCHQDQRDVDFKKLAFKGIDFKHLTLKGRDVEHLIDSTDYLDFKALGYKGDPIIHGGRFKKIPLGQRVSNK